MVLQLCKAILDTYLLINTLILLFLYFCVSKVIAEIISASLSDAKRSNQVTIISSLPLIIFMVTFMVTIESLLIYFLLFLSHIFLYLGCMATCQYTSIYIRFQEVILKRKCSEHSSQDIGGCKKQHADSLEGISS